MTATQATAYGLTTNELRDAEERWARAKLPVGLLHALLALDHRSAKAPRQAVARLIERGAAGRHEDMVVEAPLRVLDPDHREAVMRELFLRAQGQTLLLVTPEEVPLTRGTVRDKVAQRFVLVRDGKGERSRISEDERLHDA
jgi:hypothetical protein